MLKMVQGLLIIDLSVVVAVNFLNEHRDLVVTGIDVKTGHPGIKLIMAQRSVSVCVERSVAEHETVISHACSLEKYFVLVPSPKNVNQPVLVVLQHLQDLELRLNHRAFRLLVPARLLAHAAQQLEQLPLVQAVPGHKQQGQRVAQHGPQAADVAAHAGGVEAASPRRPRLEDGHDEPEQLGRRPAEHPGVQTPARVVAQGLGVGHAPEQGREEQRVGRERVRPDRLDELPPPSEEDSLLARGARELRQVTVDELGDVIRQAFQRQRRPLASLYLVPRLPDFGLEISDVVRQVLIFAALGIRPCRGQYYSH